MSPVPSATLLYEVLQAKLAKTLAYLDFSDSIVSIHVTVKITLRAITLMVLVQQLLIDQMDVRLIGKVLPVKIMIPF